MSRMKPLPGDGAGRRKLGVEIEFAGLDETAAANLIARHCGTTLSEKDGEYRIETEKFGTIEVYLDTQYKDLVGDFDLTRTVVPVELVTEPFAPEHLPALDDLAAALAAAGATGTQDGLLLGFGVHLNVQTPGEDAEALVRILTAYALIEPWLRTEMDIDLTRRILPFTAPYPATLVDALIDAGPKDAERLARLYLDHVDGRNHGLDMLPLLADLVPETVADTTDDPLVSARPAFHYRLPDSRIGSPDWSLVGEWNRWVEIEELANNKVRMEALAAAWRDHRNALLSTRGDWVRTVAQILSGHPA